MAQRPNKALFPDKRNVLEFLESLQWQRMTKSELQKLLQDYLGTDNKLSDGTCEDCKELDYSFLFTNGDGCCGSHFIDIEIYYLKMRQRNHILITGAELLDYVE